MDFSDIVADAVSGDPLRALYAVSQVGAHFHPGMDFTRSPSVRRRLSDDASFLRGGGAGGGAGSAPSQFKRAMLLPLVKGSYVGRKTAKRFVRAGGPQAIIKRQLSLGLTNWCVQNHTSAARFTGTLNSQYVKTLCRTAQNFLRAGTVTAGNRWQAYATLAEKVQQGGTYWNPTADCSMDVFSPVRSGSATTVTAYPFTRQTWELGTAFQFRDYLCYAYGMLGAGSSGVAGGTMSTGYMPPHIGAAPTYTVFPQGFPDFTAASFSGNTAVPYSRFSTSDTTDLAFLREFERRTPLYLAYEGIDFSFRNPTEQVQYVTMYELVPKDDIPMYQTTVGLGTASSNIGAWPDPKYLWDEWFKVSESISQLPSATAPLDPPTLDVLQTADWPESVVSADGGTGVVAAKPIRTRTTPGMVPGHLVHKYFYVRSRTLKLDAGCSGSMNFLINHRRVLKAADIFNNFACKGKSAMYMMVVKGERLISKSTAGVQQTSDGYTTPDVLVEWRKTAKFCRYSVKPQVHTLTVARPVRTDITAQYDVDPESGDAENTNTIA